MPIRVNYIRPKLYPKQLEAIFDSHRVSVIEASTKSGKTSGCIAWLIEQALKGKPGQNFWWVAPISRVARIAFSRACRALPKDVYVPNLGDHTIKLINDTMIWFLSGDTPDSLYGEDVYAAVVDEASRTKEEVWVALYTTLTATGGQVRVIGNVKGRRNWFYHLARKASTGVDSEYAYHKLVSADAIDAGIFPEERFEAARRALPEAAFRELYLAEPSDDQGNPFGFDYIRKCTAPLTTNKPAVWGWDFARGAKNMDDERDWTVGIALDSEGHSCRFERWQAPWEATHIRITAATRTTRALCDATGVGDPVVERLQKEPGSKYEGYTFSSGSKQQLIEALVVAIQKSEITFPEGVITQELEVFEYEYTARGQVRYCAPEGYHDDAVVALALANLHKSHSKPALKVTKEIVAKSRLRVMGLSRMGQW